MVWVRCGMKMPTLCGNAGRLSEAYRPFLNADGDLQVGDAFGLEAQWIAGLLMEQTEAYDYPESCWTMVQVKEDEQGMGCVRCGDEEVDSMRGLCWWCAQL